MAEVLIRNLDPGVVERLKERARRSGRSVQAELQMIVERAVLTDAVEGRELAARIRRKLAGGKHSDSAALIAADRRR